MKYLKIAIISSLSAMNALAIAMQLNQADQFKAVDAIEQQIYCSSSPFTPDLRSPSQDNSHIQPAKNTRKIEPPFCDDCKIQQRLHTHYFKTHKIKGCNEICALRQIINTILASNTGASYYYLKYSTWNLSRTLCREPWAYDSSLKIFEKAKEILEDIRCDSMKKGKTNWFISKEKIDWFVSFVITYFQWWRNGAKKKFTFTYRGYREQFYIW